MKRAILCVFVVATTTTAARAQSYTNTTTIDNNVKAGNLCNFDCKMAWSSGVTADLPHESWALGSVQDAKRTSYSAGLR